CSVNSAGTLPTAADSEEHANSNMARRLATPAMQLRLRDVRCLCMASLSWFVFTNRSMRCLLRHDLRLLRGLRRVMNHRVGVFHPNPVSAGLRSKQFHERVVVFPFRPVALPLEQSCNGRETHRAGLHHAGERGFLRAWRSRTTAVFDDVNVVTRAEH